MDPFPVKANSKIEIDSLERTISISLQKTVIDTRDKSIEQIRFLELSTFKKLQSCHFMIQPEKKRGKLMISHVRPILISIFTMYDLSYLEFLQCTTYTIQYFYNVRPILLRNFTFFYLLTEIFIPYKLKGTKYLNIALFSFKCTCKISLLLTVVHSTQQLLETCLI